MTELTIHTQADADAKIPAWLRGEGPFHLRVEPMELIDVIVWLFSDYDRYCIDDRFGIPANASRAKLSLVTVSGGDSPLHPDWVRSLRDQCAAAGVEFVFKSWGEWSNRHPQSPPIPGQEVERCVVGDPEVDGIMMYRVGRSRSGRVLDGRTHDGKGGGE